MTKMTHPNGKVFESSCSECNKDEWVKEVTRQFITEHCWWFDGTDTLTESENGN